MSAARAVVNRSAPGSTVVPVLVYEDVDKAIEWLCGAFGFTERFRAAGPGGKATHAQLGIGNADLMIGASGAEFRSPRANEVNQYVLVRVQDVDGHFDHAKLFGARIVYAPRNMPFGERAYTVEDLAGHRWTFSPQLLGIRNSVPRVHVQLKDLESWGFIKRVAAYPAIYQITKSVTRLMGADLPARREHANETIRTRLLTVNFYLEAIRWPVEFVFDHRQKISRLCKLGCQPALFPERGGRPYLWQDILLQRPSGELILTMLAPDGGRVAEERQVA